MTEWNAGGYYRQSALQKWVADEHLASLTLAEPLHCSAVEVPCTTLDGLAENDPMVGAGSVTVTPHVAVVPRVTVTV